MQTHTLDCRGMKCPAPILQLARTARSLGRAPAVLEVQADDGDFPKDLRAWCRASKAELLSLEEVDGVFQAKIVVSPNVSRPPTTGTSAPPTSREGSGAVEPFRVTPSGAAAAHTVAAQPVFTKASAPPPPTNEQRKSWHPPAQSPASQRIDCLGMRCPAPILTLARAYKGLAGKPSLFEVLADDGDFPSDLRAWCRTSHVQLAELTERGGHFYALLAANGADAKAIPSLDGTALQSLPGSRVEPSIEEVSAVEVDLDSVPISIPLSSKPVLGPTSLPNTLSPSELAKTRSLPRLDLRGLQAPHPMLRLSQALMQGTHVNLEVVADDPGFHNDLHSWAAAMKVTLDSVAAEDGVTRAHLTFPSIAVVPGSSILPPTGLPPTATTSLAPIPSAPLGSDNPERRENLATFLVLKNDFESLLAALMCASTAAAQGSRVSVYFSFWGVNLLRGERPRSGVPSIASISPLQRMMKLMMPKGPRRQKMSKMHMGGMGKGLMQHFMKKNNVMTIEQLMQNCEEQGVRFVVCSMSMGIMGIEKRDIMEMSNIDFAGVTSFVEESRRASMSLVF